MDVVLEVFDTYLFDYIYANVAPSPLAIQYGWKASPPNNTFSDLLHPAPATANGWTYKQTTDYLRMEPGQYAYMSRWDRENAMRQAISLFFITW